mgnify:FL=1
MRGGFLLGTIVGAAATAIYMSRKNNNNMNVNRLGQMVTSAIGDGFKMVGVGNKQADATTSTQGKGNSQHNDNKASQQQNNKQLEQMISKDANVQKKVDEILTQNTH